MKKEFPNCWDIRKCGMQKGGEKAKKHGECPVSEMKMGHSCMIISSALQDGTPCCPKDFDEPSHCFECVVYALYNRANGLNALYLDEKFPNETNIYKKILAKGYRADQKDDDDLD